MEHCPYPQNPLVPKVKIPYLEHPPFDGDFSTFPTRNGWDRTEFLTGELKSGSPEKAAAFLQTWLYFGLASSIFGDKIKNIKELFVRPDPDKPGSYIISTDGLNPALEEWADKFMDLPDDEMKKHLEYAGRCFDEASFFVRAMEASDAEESNTNDGSGTDAMPGPSGIFRLDVEYPAIHLSIIALGDHLWNSLNQVEYQMKNRIHTAAAAVTSIVGGKRSFLGKMVGKVEKSANKALQSKHKFNFSYPVGSPQPLGKSTLAPEHDYEWGKAILSQLNSTMGWEQSRPAVGWPSWGTSQLLRSRLRDAGWCMYEAERAQDILSPWAVHFAGAISWPMLSVLKEKQSIVHSEPQTEEEKLRAPQPDLPLLEHNGCTVRHCAAHNINEATYKTRHVLKDCNCEFIGLPKEDVKKVFQEPGEKFPVIKAVLDLDGNNGKGDVTLECASAGAGDVRFIALSHVWSHGLGNAKENTLPKCQFARLVKLIREKNPLRNTLLERHGDLIRKKDNVITVWLWIDTICVPLEPEYRKLAISRMSRVYGTCAFLWVLDLGLVPISLAACSQAEALIRVYCSVWMQRMWTLQEGAARNCRIIFADGLVAMANVSHELFTRPNQPIARRGGYFDVMLQMQDASYRPMTNWENHGFQWSRKGLDVYVPDCSRFTRIWNGLAWRSSTKSSDQPLILAALVFGKFEMKPKTSAVDKPEKTPQTMYEIAEEKLSAVVTSPGSNRWLTFYKQHEACPQGILFANCPTLNDPGYRWAPCEIGTTHRTIADFTPGLVTPEGLVVKLPGYKLLSLPADSASGFEFMDTTRREWFSVKPMRAGEALDVTPTNSWNFYAIIMGSLMTTYEAMPGVLVTTEGDGPKDGVLSVKFGRKVFVTRKLTEQEPELNAKMASSPHLVTRSERYENTQAWCVA